MQTVFPALADAQHRGGVDAPKAVEAGGQD